jgi:hypothetical protein
MLQRAGFAMGRPGCRGTKGKYKLFDLIVEYTSVLARLPEMDPCIALFARAI